MDIKKFIKKEENLKSKLNFKNLWINLLVLNKKQQIFWMKI